MCENAKNRNATRMTFFSSISKSNALANWMPETVLERITYSAAIECLRVFTQPRPLADMRGSANDPVIRVLQLAARLAPLPPPTPRILAAARHVSAVRLIGNASQPTAPEIELYAT